MSNSMNTNNKNTNNKKLKRKPHERVFIVSERYAGKRSLTDIFADLLYSAYRENESGGTGEELNRIGYLPEHEEHAPYGDGAY